jgi:prevent-host-death family protein
MYTIAIWEPATMRITSVELHQKLGKTIDRARQEPVVVTKHDRDHVVIISAEEYADLRQSYRRARLTGSLSEEEIEQIKQARVPSKAEQKRLMAEMAEAVASGTIRLRKS